MAARSRPVGGLATLGSGLLVLGLLTAGLAWWLASPEAPPLAPTATLAQASAPVAAPPPASVPNAEGGQGRIEVPDSLPPVQPLDVEAPPAFRLDVDGTVPARLVGRVVDARGGPVPGAILVHVPSAAGRLLQGLPPSYRVERPDWKQHVISRSDDQGRFRFVAHDAPRFSRSGSSGVGSVPLDIPVLISRHPDHRLTATRCPPWRGGTVDLGDIVMQDPVTLSGRLVDGDGHPIADGHVGPSTADPSAKGLDAPHWYLLREALNASSQDDGRFTIRGWWPDTVTLDCGADGFASRLIEYTALGTGPRDLGDVVLSRASVLGGTVVDSRGRGLPGVDVVARPSAAHRNHAEGDVDLRDHQSQIDHGGFQEQRVTTGADGSFAFTTLADWPVDVIAADDAREPASARDVNPGAPALRLELFDAARLHVQVVSADDGAPLADATVHAVRLAHRPRPLNPAPSSARLTVRALTSPDHATGEIASNTGAFVIERAGSVATRVTASAPGRAHVLVDLPGLPPGERATHRIQLPPARRVHGQLVDEAEAPVADVAVSLRIVQLDHTHAVIEGVSDATGVFTLLVPSVDRWLLRTSHPRFAEHLQILKLKSGEDVDLGAITLTRGSTLVGRVVDSAGGPLGGRVVRAVPKGDRGRGKQTVSDGLGQFAFHELASGAYSVRSEPGGRRPVMLPPGGRVEIELVVPVLTHVHGTVLGPSGPRADVAVMSLHHHAGKPKVLTTTDAGGRFACDVAGTDVMLIARDGDQVSESVHAQLAGVDDVRVDLSFTSSTVRGVIVDALSDKPLGNVRVQPRPVIADGGQALQGQSPGWVATGNDGRFVIEGLPPGSWSLSVSSSWTLPESQVVEVGQGSLVSHADFRLRACGMLRGAVDVTDTGRSPGELIVWALPLSGDETPRSTPVNAIHRAALQHLAPGPWRLELRDREAPPPDADPQPPYGSVQVDVVAGTSVEFELVGAQR